MTEVLKVDSFAEVIADIASEFTEYQLAVDGLVRNVKPFGVDNNVMVTLPPSTELFNGKASVTPPPWTSNDAKTESNDTD